MPYILKHKTKGYVAEGMFVGSEIKYTFDLYKAELFTEDLLSYFKDRVKYDDIVNIEIFTYNYKLYLKDNKGTIFDHFAADIITKE